MTERDAPRRKKRGRVAALALFGGLAAALVWLLQFSGLDLGGLGENLPGLEEESEKSEEKEAPPPPDAASPEQETSGDQPPTKRACELRLDADGLYYGGEKVTTEEAIAGCREAGKAMLVVTGDARYGALEETRKALEQEGIAVHVR